MRYKGRLTWELGRYKVEVMLPQMGCIGLRRSIGLRLVVPNNLSTRSTGTQLMRSTSTLLGVGVGVGVGPKARGRGRPRG